MTFRMMILYLALLAGSAFSVEFSRLGDLQAELSKQDSGSVWLANPIPDVRMGPSQTKTLDITDVFSVNPDTAAMDFDFPVSSDNSMVTGNMTYNETTGKLYLDLVSKTVYGTARVSVRVNTEFGSAADTLIVKVDDPDNEFLEWGTVYGFDPYNNLGSGTEEWTSALDFSLGSSVYELKEIEFGYAWDGVTEWRIVPFETVPVDTGYSFHSGTKSFKGGTPAYIEDLAGTITGHIAIVFTTTANFMQMDPGGDGGHTWIYPAGEDSLWTHPEDISADYAGAWYVRLFVRDITSGIEHTIESGKSHELTGNYPNPFNSETVIKWTMGEPGKAFINVYNSKGQKVSVLEGGNFEKGVHETGFNASGLNSGIYYYDLIVNGRLEGSSRMLYLK